ncbi:Gmad2 immunoglobulin-like domain-containing protein [Oceanobacillus sp. CAU 1775]
MRNNRLFILLASLLFVAFFLVACGTSNEPTENEQGNADEDVEVEEPAEEEEVEEDASNEEDTDEENTSEESEEVDNEAEESTSTEDETESEPQVVLENDAFRIFEPAPNSEVGNTFTVRGEARVFEAVVTYEFEDGHFILDEGIAMTDQGAPDWGEFEITISFDELSNDHGTVFLYEQSQKDGSRQHELAIPVKHKK